MMQIDERAIMAAANNADLYEAVFKAQGLQFERLSCAFVALNKPPPFYSNLTVLDPTRPHDVLLKIKQVQSQRGTKMVFKDGFRQFDPTEHGFRLLFEATWIWRDSTGVAPASHWQRMTSPTDLQLWETAWKNAGSQTDHTMFPPEILKQPDVHFLGHKVDDTLLSGCIANVSTACLGLSNVFTVDAQKDVFADACAAVQCVDPHKPIVGFESGDSLDEALSVGFEPIGPLRILAADPPAS